MLKLRHLTLCLAICSAAMAADNITGWRNDGSGLFPNATPSLKWDGEKKEGGGILWKTKIGKNLFSSPILVGEKLFVLADPDKLICLDANTGKELWSKTTTLADLPEKPAEDPEETNDEVGNTTPTPITDGKNIYVLFANGLVTSFDLTGNRQWITYMSEPSATSYGRSASPCLADDKLIVSTGILTALDKNTGKTLWKADKKVEEQFGTPVATKVGEGGGETLIVAPSGHILKASDGSILAKFGDLSYASPIVVGDKAFFIDASSYAVQLSPNAADIKRIWRNNDLEGEFYSSPIHHDGLIYTLSYQGQLYVLDAATGKTVYDQKLKIANMSGEPDVPAGNIYQSLCLAGGKIYLSNEPGETLIIEPGREYKQLAHNHLNEQIAGSLTFAGKRIYIRTKDSILCIE
ncbi:MAG: PQQ-binding-like beta-propeller repeat protein [Phycisphaerales bacterium]|nr:PQQ-binding-like beta-propeller repeat protein [Phycisphaerales bacterium]